MLIWTQNEVGSQAESPWGTFFLRPAAEKNASGETVFDLTLLAHEGTRGYRGEYHQVLGTFSSPYFARQIAEMIAAERPVF